MILFFLLVLGLLVGSFLNVVIFRIAKNQSFVRGRSRCLSCGYQLAWYDNIPLLSFVWLVGKCRSCQVKLSWQYPLVELATALLFGGSFLVVNPTGDSWQLAAFSMLLIVLCFATLITLYDLRFSLIPDAFLWGLNLSTFAFLSCHWLSSSPFPPAFLPSPSVAFMGAVLAGAFFYLLVSLSRETWMGWGDVWLGVWGGMLTGLLLVQLFITLAFTLGAVVGLGLIFAQKKTLKTQIPFAPYILGAGLLLLAAMYQVPEVLQFLSPWLPGTIE